METQFEKVPSSVHEMPEHGETFNAARERLNQTLAYADETVHKNPWTSVGIGFGVGVVIGALITLAASSR